MLVRVVVSFHLPRRSLWYTVDPLGLGPLCLYSWSVSDFDSLRSMQMQGDPRAKALCPSRSVRGDLGQGPLGPLPSKVCCILLVELPLAVFLYPSACATWVHTLQYVQRGTWYPSAGTKYAPGLLSLSGRWSRYAAPTTIILTN